MRTAICSAIWLAVPLLCYGATPAQQPADPSAQGQKALPPGGQPGVPKPAGGVQGEPSPGTPPPAAPANDTNYIIGAEDALNITVWADPRLSGPFLVRSDGRISMNLIGEVMASGKTPAKLGADIETLLKEKEILRRPHPDQVPSTVRARSLVRMDNPQVAARPSPVK